MNRKAAASCLLLALATLGVSKADEKEQLVKFLAEVDALLASDDIPGVAKAIEANGDTDDAMKKYFVVTRHLYRTKHDIPNMLAVGQAGIKYLLGQADKARKNDAALADKWKGLAKSMAYNISVNAWPGWNEKGINIQREQSVRALHFAQENLRLAEVLKRPADVRGNAYWLIGAQLLALEQPAKAIMQFKKAAKEFDSAKKHDYRHMAEGYIGIAQLTRAASRAQGRATLEKALANLAADKTDDGKFFASQLRQVEKVFARTTEDP